MNFEENSTHLLKSVGLKCTRTRMDLLALFMKNEHALSYGNLETLTDGVYDKVTVYRTLKTFEEKGILHEVMDGGPMVKYGLCSTGCSGGHHHDSHIHFKCDACEKTFCMDEYRVPQFQLPAKFKTRKVSVLVEGVCEHCQT